MGWWGLKEYIYQHTHGMNDTNLSYQRCSQVKLNRPLREAFFQLDVTKFNYHVKLFSNQSSGNKKSVEGFSCLVQSIYSNSKSAKCKYKCVHQSAVSSGFYFCYISNAFMDEQSLGLWVCSYYRTASRSTHSLSDLTSRGLFAF